MSCRRFSKKRDQAVVHRSFVPWLAGLLRRDGASGAAKLRRNLLGVTRNRRVKGAPKRIRAVEADRLGDVFDRSSACVSRRRASFSRSVSTNIAGEEPNCSLKRRKNWRGESAARARKRFDRHLGGRIVRHPGDQLREAIARVASGIGAARSIAPVRRNVSGKRPSRARRSSAIFDPKSSSIMASARSMPAVTPAEV